MICHIIGWAGPWGGSGRGNVIEIHCVKNFRLNIFLKQKCTF